jgi:hypothetical protein
VDTVSARPGWPHKEPGGLGIWLDRMRAYVDSRVSAPPRRGEPVALTILAPSTSVGPITVTRNPDGSATLDGHLDIPGPLGAGDPLSFARMPEGFGTADPVGLMARAVVSGGLAPIVVGIDVNGGDGGDLFVIGPDVAAGELLMVVLDGVTFWPAPRPAP